MATVNESDVRKWLKVVQEKENVKELLIDAISGSDKGDGYGSNIIFIKATATSDNGSEKSYNFAVKFNRQGQMLPEIFANEIFMYKEVFPAFTRFQAEFGIDKPFNRVPKLYAGFSSDGNDVIILENLKKLGFGLWDNKKPWIRENIDLVAQEYGKFHAISAAFKEQKPEAFQKLAEKLDNNIGKAFDKLGMIYLLEDVVAELGPLLKNTLSETILEKWSNLKRQVNYIFTNLIQNIAGFKVIIHGDCWSNNFLLKLQNEENPVISEFAMLDWQFSTFSSPVLDLSYFLFACTAHDDFANFDSFLKSYYSSFSNYLKLLGGNPDLAYPEDQFLKDWKEYSKFGIVLCLFPLKLSYVDKEDTPDPAKAAKAGKNPISAFSVEVKNKESYRNRVVGIIKYAVEHELV